MNDLQDLFADIPKVSTQPKKKETTPSKISLLDLRRAQTIGIMLSRFKLPLAAVSRAIQRMDARALTLDDVNALKSFLPTEEEVKLLRAYRGDLELLAPPDLHFVNLMQIPFLERRLEAFAFILSFDSRVKILKASIDNVKEGCVEVTRSEDLKFLFSSILALGNTLNDGSFAGNAKGFKLESILKLGELKSNVGKQPADFFLYLVEKFYKDRPKLFDLPDKFQHVSRASRECFLDLEKECNCLLEGMRNLKDLLKEGDQDSVLTGVIQAFHSRTSDIPTDLSRELSQVQDSFKKVAEFLAEEVDDGSPGSLFTILHSFACKLEQEKNALLRREAEKEARHRRRIQQEQRRAELQLSAKKASHKSQRGAGSPDKSQPASDPTASNVDEVIEVLSKHSKVAVHLLRNASMHSEERGEET